MRFRLRKRLIVAAIVSAAIIPAMLIGASSALADGGSGTTINAKAGAGESGYSVNAFLPQKLTVQTGTTVNWSFTWPEPHMIVLDNGLTPADLSGPEPPADTSPFDFDGVRKYVYSGVIFGQPGNGPTFAIKFEKAGNYNIECLIHPGMTGKVTVVDSGTADTQVPEQFGVHLCRMTFALTSLELVVVGLDMERAERITTLAGLLMAKVMLVLAFFMRARTSRPAVRLALAAIALAVAAAVVLMLEMVFRVRVA